MACCCGDIRDGNTRAKYPRPFELTNALPIAQSELSLIDTEYGTNGSAMSSSMTRDQLCRATTAFVRAALEFVAARQELLLIGYSGLALSLAAGSALALFGFLTGGLGLALGLAIAALGGTFTALTGADLINALRDRVASNELICYFTDLWISGTVTRAEYDAAINGMVGVGNTRQAQVWAIKNYFASDEGHYMFLKFADQAIAGEQRDCVRCGNSLHYIITGRSEVLLGVEINANSGVPQMYISMNRNGSENFDPTIKVENDNGCWIYGGATGSAFPPSVQWYTPCDGSEIEGVAPFGSEVIRLRYASWINGGTVVGLYVSSGSTFEIVNT